MIEVALSGTETRTLPQEACCQIFLLPELLRAIFENLERIDQVRCALVNTAWSEIALDQVWYDIDDLRLLLNALSPLEKDGSRKYKFNPKPTPKFWPRFEEKYCTRVRILRHTGTRKYEISSLLDTVLRIRPLRPLLPNLHTLKWDGTQRGFDDAIIFMHDGIREFKMVDDVSDIDNAKELSGIWETVRSQMPLLTHIVVQVPPLASHLDQITQLIKNLPQLKSLELPAFEETSKILPCVLGISQLKRMKFNFSFIPSSESNDDKIISIRDVGCYMDSPDLDIPPQLEDIDFHCASLGATMAFFQSRGFSQLTHLRKITICTAAIEEPPLLGQFVTTISQTCRQITNFEFVLYSAVSKRILESQDSPDLPVLTCREIVSFSNIRGILNCNEMIEFSFRHPYGLDITDFDIKELATAWPKLKSVRLGSNPVQRVDRGLIRNPTMNAFVSFVEHCPLIEEIYLIVDATLPLNLPKGSTTASQTLHTIGVGISEIGDENAVVMFLSQLCGPQCKLLRASVDRFEKLRSKSMHSKWQKVAKLLPLLTGFKGQFDAKDEGDIG